MDLSLTNEEISRSPPMDNVQMPTFCFWLVFSHLQWFQFLFCYGTYRQDFSFSSHLNYLFRDIRNENSQINWIPFENSIEIYLLTSGRDWKLSITKLNVSWKKQVGNELLFLWKRQPVARHVHYYFPNCRWWYPIHIIDLYRIYRYNLPRKG
jgi:hypothetical protein